MALNANLEIIGEFIRTQRSNVLDSVCEIEALEFMKQANVQNAVYDVFGTALDFIEAANRLRISTRTALIICLIADINNVRMDSQPFMLYRERTLEKSLKEVLVLTSSNCLRQIIADLSTKEIVKLKALTLPRDVKLFGLALLQVGLSRMEVAYILNESTIEDIEAYYDFLIDQKIENKYMSLIDKESLLKEFPLNKYEKVSISGIVALATLFGVKLRQKSEARRLTAEEKGLISSAFQDGNSLNSIVAIVFRETGNIRSKSIIHSFLRSKEFDTSSNARHATKFLAANRGLIEEFLSSDYYFEWAKRTGRKSSIQALAAYLNEKASPHPGKHIIKSYNVFRMALPRLDQDTYRRVLNFPKNRVR